MYYVYIMYYKYYVHNTSCLLEKTSLVCSLVLHTKHICKYLETKSYDSFLSLLITLHRCREEFIFPFEV